MAMVHGAKQEAQSDNDKINALILKAEQLYNQLNKFHNQFHDSLEDVDTESRKRFVYFDNQLDLSVFQSPKIDWKKSTLGYDRKLQSKIITAPFFKYKNFN